MAAVLPIACPRWGRQAAKKTCKTRDASVMSESLDSCGRATSGLVQQRGKPENSTAPTTTRVQREQRLTGACWGSLGLPDYGRMLRRARLTGAAAWLRRAPIRRRLAQPAALCGLASPGRAPERGSNLQPSDDRDTTFCATSDLLAAWVCMDRGATIDLVRSATPKPTPCAYSSRAWL